MDMKRTSLRDTPFQGFVMREEFILEHCRGRTVLHLGCIGFQDLPVAERVRRFKDTLHCKLMNCSKVTGVDYSQDAVESVREVLGDNEVLCLDVEKELGALLRKRRFEVILAGDIIEHLSNPGAFLGELKQCGSETTVLVTTPNAFGLRLAIRNLFGRLDDSHEHAYMFSPLVLRNLFHRYGFTDLKFFGGMQETVIAHSAIGRHLGTQLFRWFPRFSGTLCVLARQGSSR
jgi:2-polyprenyl-3-methyl-5-hydroxy-6-metoxy-1,4-benzoquinol methylase